MKCFKYKILKGNELILTNWINSESKEQALNKLKQEFNEHEIKIIEV